MKRHRKNSLLLLSFIIGWVLLPTIQILPGAWAAEKANLQKKNGEKVRVAVYGGEGAFDKSITASIKMFQWMGAEAQRITPEEIGQGKLRQFDILSMTSGWAVPYKRDLWGQGVKEIRSFLEKGGGYIGICAGAFFAANPIIWEGGTYEYPLGIFPDIADGPIVEIAPWPQYKMCRINISTHNHPIMQGQPSSLSVMYYGGPWFHIPSKPRMDILAHYAVNGKPAMVSYSYGKGRVFLIGVHPEFEEGSDRDGVTWDDDLHDGESEWPLMQEVVRWMVQGK